MIYTFTTFNLDRNKPYKRRNTFHFLADCRARIFPYQKHCQFCWWISRGVVQLSHVTLYQECTTIRARAANKWLVLLPFSGCYIIFGKSLYFGGVYQMVLIVSGVETVKANFFIKTYKQGIKSNLRLYSTTYWELTMLNLIDHRNRIGIVGNFWWWGVSKTLHCSCPLKSLQIGTKTCQWTDKMNLICH